MITCPNYLVIYNDPSLAIVSLYQSLSKIKYNGYLKSILDITHILFSCNIRLVFMVYLFSALINTVTSCLSRTIYILTR